MVTYFNKKDLVKFGQYLLSEERTKRIVDNYDAKIDNLTIEERLREVYHADVENFIESIKKVE